ncbi:MAG: hybrid sensor histidine kinase/response regulator, partial [Bartonella sp.]|nr:hybrid sensor histidine kinase/response regulator [Bartonella sp.]
FNNVLTAILMSCDLLLNTHRSSDPAYADLINIKNNANRAAALVQQLLAFSRKQTLRPKKVDFTELLSDIRNLILPLLGNNIQLKIIHGKDLWDVKVDQASFQR